MRQNRPSFLLLKFVAPDLENDKRLGSMALVEDEVTAGAKALARNWQPAKLKLLERLSQVWRFSIADRGRKASLILVYPDDWPAVFDSGCED